MASMSSVISHKHIHHIFKGSKCLLTSFDLLNRDAFEEPGPHTIREREGILCDDTVPIPGSPAVIEGIQSLFIPLHEVENQAPEIPELDIIRINDQYLINTGK